MVAGDIVADGIRDVLSLMAISARTAPKARGLDEVVIKALAGDELDRVADEMDRIARETGREWFARDADNVRKSAAALVIGVKGRKSKGLDCGACGYAKCAEFERAEKSRKALDLPGPNCVFQAIDLGIAVGSAAKTASLLNVDNRVMYSVGVAALRLGLIDADVALGIPLSATGKSIYFDRRR